MSLKQMLSRYHQLRKELESVGFLAPWEYDEYTRLGKRLGTLVLDR